MTPCCMCLKPAWRWMSWWNTEYEHLRRGQQGNLCETHTKEVWQALSLLARERVMLTACAKLKGDK